MLPDRDGKREPPPPPQRVNSRLSPEKFAPPVALPANHAQLRSPPTPPTLYPNSPQTPLTPPTPQGPGPGLGTGQSPGPILGISLEDEFTRVSVFNPIPLTDLTHPPFASASCNIGGIKLLLQKVKCSF